MHTIGPYSFTEQDARRTVENHEIVWQLLSDGRDASVLAPLAPTLDGDLATDLPKVWAAWAEAGRALRAAGQLPARAEGSVTGLHVSDGGVPKRAVDEIEVGWSGVRGDRQATRVHHGRPWQALCIWNDESIDALRADGHPIDRGLAGENITVSGLPWWEVRAGVDLRIGSVRCTVSAFALPCSKNAQWFVDGRFQAMHHDTGRSRVYATVTEPGVVRIGDSVVLEP